MSRVLGQVHAERITRQAAEAIGLTVPPTARWDVALGGLVFNPLRLLLKDGHTYADNCFCPLNDPEHAYQIEITLQINVFHKRMSDDSYVISLRSSEDAAAGALVQSVRKGDDAMRLRMECVVMFAALTTLVEAEV
jgi:hypothetical protein